MGNILILIIIKIQLIMSQINIEDNLSDPVHT